MEESCLAGDEFTGDALTCHLLEDDPEKTRSLFDAADRVRREKVGDEVHIRGIIEFSNYCRKDCLYCGLRKSNDLLFRYRMSLEQIYEAASEARRLDFKTVVLQSGEDTAYSVRELCDLISKLKKDLSLAVTLCIGERTFEEYKMFKDAGADRYLLKFETSSPALFRA